MRTLYKAWGWLANDPHQLIGVRILQIFIGAILLFQIFIELPFAGYLWGPHGLGYGSTIPVLGPMLGNVFDRVFTTDAGIFFVLFILGIGALGLLFGCSTRVATFVVLISFSLLYKRLPELRDGGDDITRLMLIYMLFLLPHRAKFSSGPLRVWLHNIAVLAITFQLMVMYLASGFAKATGEWWQQGVAMYYVSQVQWYTLPGAHELFTNPWIVTLATYVSMFYQLLFPVAIISRMKLPWILLGILFHLSIAVLMGLLTFSTVMIGLELFLISDQEYAKLWNRGYFLIKYRQWY
jgi:hypothetical protein